MKKLVVVIALVVLSISELAAQTRIGYSQYMHNHAIYNPAYKEVNYDLGGTAFVRHQMYGFEDAPVTYIASVFYNLDPHGFQLNILRDKVANFRHFEIGGGYNYTLSMDSYTTLSFGAKASYNIQTADYGGLQVFDGGDPALGGGVSRNSFNFGAGAFAMNDYWHAGVGSPYLFNNGLLGGNTSIFNMSYNHFFLTGGYMFIDDEYLTFYPTALIKLTKGTPLDISLDMNALFAGYIWGSIGYRLNNTVVISAGVIVLDNLKIVYSYDLGLGGANRYGGMTHELSVGYGLDLFKNSFAKRKYLNKRGEFKGNKRKGKGDNIDNTVPDSQLNKGSK